MTAGRSRWSESATRVTLTDDPLARSFAPPASFDPASLTRSGRPIWIAPAAEHATPEVVAYRLQYSVSTATVARVHVSADERYELWLDGQRVGRGPERGSNVEWSYETYDLALSAGEHVLVALVWSLGALAPLAQISIQRGFLLAAEAPFVELLATGCAPWQAKRLDGYAFQRPDVGEYDPWFSGPTQTTDASLLSWGVEHGEGDGWGAVASRMEDIASFVGDMRGHQLTPATLPAQRGAIRRAGTVGYAAAVAWTDPKVQYVDPARNSPDAITMWQAMVDGVGTVTIPAYSTWQVVIDVGTYICAYPELVVDGGSGSEIHLCWAEALFDDEGGVGKGRRDRVDGAYFYAPINDTFRLDGGRRTLGTVWWRAGRLVQALIATGDEPLTIESLTLEESRYPLEMESTVDSDDRDINEFVPLAVRSLQMCAHETYMDCPHYEQLMYVGDTRIETLITYAISADDRLPRKAIRTFDLSRLASGATQARAPSRDPQIIPPFSMWWVAMVHDFAMWRDDSSLVRASMPGVRAVVEYFLSNVDDSGLLRSPAGWNFGDWADAWTVGVPPDGAAGRSGLFNWHLAYTLERAADLEDMCGEPELAARLRHRRDALVGEVRDRFWDATRGLFADDLDHRYFSQHSQCLAVLSGTLSEFELERLRHGLVSDSTLTPTTIYFSHYLFEAYRVLDAPDALFDRLRFWTELSAQGFVTTPEKHEPTRSDCHAWGAHPLFHAFATMLGVRPSAPGFASVDITPMLGPLQRMSASMVHPKGRLDVNLSVAGSVLTGEIALPAGVSGVLRFGNDIRHLASGLQRVTLG